MKPIFSVSIQNASRCQSIPNRNQIRRWVKASNRVECEVTIRFVDTEEGQWLNREYRNKDYATNVLTFPLTEFPHLMGDIIICVPVVEQEAIDMGISLEAHFAHLVVHGVLHLHGYDHEENAPAELMEAMETEILSNLGYANPYLIT